jgi:molecular chaperone DnaK
MSKEDIEKAQKEAEAHADEDKKKRESVDARNTLENGIYQAEKMPSEFEKISDEDKKVIEDAVTEAKKVQADDSADKETLEAAAKKLTDTIMPIGAKMYEQAAKEEAPASEEGDGKDKKSDKDEPVEGEVVDDSKK